MPTHRTIEPEDAILGVGLDIDIRTAINQYAQDAGYKLTALFRNGLRIVQKTVLISPSQANALLDPTIQTNALLEHLRQARALPDDSSQLLQRSRITINRQIDPD